MWYSSLAGIDQGTHDSGVCSKRFMSFQIAQANIRITHALTLLQHARSTLQPVVLTLRRTSRGVVWVFEFELKGKRVKSEDMWISSGETE